MKTLNIFYLVIFWTQNVHNYFIFLCSLHCVLFHSLLRDDFPSTAAMAPGVTICCAWPGRREYVTEIMPFMNFLVHSYTCCSDRHSSPYWTFIRRWIPLGFTPSLLKKQMTERCSSLMHFARWPPFLHYYCAVVLYSCNVLPSVGQSSNHEYHYCQLTSQSSCV